MKHKKNRQPFWIMLLAIGSTLHAGCSDHPGREEKEAVTRQAEAFPATPPIEVPVRTDNPEDGWRFFMLTKNSRYTIEASGKKKRYHINGKVFIEINKAAFPLQLFTRAVQVNIMEPSLLLVEAFDQEQGEEIDVLRGKMIVSKRYKSPFAEPDTLEGGNMYMINTGIDLAEKEMLDTSALSRWWQERK